MRTHRRPQHRPLDLVFSASSHVPMLHALLATTEGMQGGLEYLRSLIEDEARIAKTGEPYTAMDVTRMAAQLARYRTWVEGILRP